MKEKKIKVLKVEPGKYPEKAVLNNTLSALQAAVGGLIEIISLETDVCLICNEEGKLIGLEGNRRLGNDIIAGIFYVTGSDDEGNLTSLSGEKYEYYKEMFHIPEKFSKES